MRKRIVDSRTMRARKARARRIVAYLKEAYPVPKSELRYRTPFQFLVAVMLSAQCTDKAVNECTKKLFATYKIPRDFANVDPAVLAREIKSLTFFNNKAKHIVAAAKRVTEHFNGKVPKTAEELQTLPGVAYKTAHVVLGELYGMYEGIPTDTHVKRFAKRFELSDENDLTRISRDLEALVPREDWKYVNNGLVLYGRYVCPARPHDCASHPLTRLYPKALTIWPKVR